ncbi:hypothetical protein C4D60_Mb02t03650 [Musa balbisiana]|uniref:Uncharacterized protein n=1 Tax=Musa balbisiana TaxID=52838 RepID=A0A4S8I803_MUSBA|nr:hypothetical protein C4D60_Mb02t03650 [Musa balbisiana]
MFNSSSLILFSVTAAALDNHSRAIDASETTSGGCELEKKASSRREVPGNASSKYQSVTKFVEHGLKPQLHLHPKFTTHVETIVSGGSFATFSMKHMQKSMAEIFKVQKKHGRMTCYLHRSPLLVNCLMEQSEMMSLQIKIHEQQS